MAGHNKWSKIKRKKAVEDAQRSKAFSKIARIIEIAAREGDDPEKNATLRAAIDQARAINMPNANIERAIKKGSGVGVDASALEEITYEAYGPGGVAILISCITDNKNRTVSELKHLLSNNDGTLADAGSVRWIFSSDNQTFTVPLSEKDAQKLTRLIDEITNREDVKSVVTNAKE